LCLCLTAEGVKQFWPVVVGDRGDRVVGGAGGGGGGNHRVLCREEAAGGITR